MKHRMFNYLFWGLSLSLFTSLFAMANETGEIGTAYQAKKKGISERVVGTGLTQAQRQQLLKLINQARASSRKCGTTTYPATTALTLESRLTSAAQAHSDDMALHNFFSHTGSDGSSAATRVTRTGYSWSRVGENIAAGYTTINAVVAGWLKSPGHCANIMNKNYKHMGIAKATNPSAQYSTYWTQVFAKPL